jgi:hypothetical protein
MKFITADLVFIILRSNHMAIFDANSGQLKKSRFLQKIQDKLESFNLLPMRLKFAKDLTTRKGKTSILLKYEDKDDIKVHHFFWFSTQSRKFLGGSGGDFEWGYEI